MKPELYKSVQCTAVYRIKCTDCQATYIGETYRNLKTRLTEHKRATKNGDITNHISEHHRLTKHKIDWDSAECVTYSTNYQQRLTLESWYTNSEQEPQNRCEQLPAPYKHLKGNRQTANNRRIENNSNNNFHVLTTNHITTKLTKPNQDRYSDPVYLKNVTVSLCISKGINIFKHGQHKDTFFLHKMNIMNSNRDKILDFWYLFF